MDEAEREEHIKRLSNGEALAAAAAAEVEEEEGRNEAQPRRHRNVVIERYKGLGGMKSDQIWKTTMDQATRTILTVETAHALERASPSRS